MSARQLRRKQAESLEGEDPIESDEEFERPSGPFNAFAMLSVEGDHDDDEDFTEEEEEKPPQPTPKQSQKKKNKKKKNKGKQKQEEPEESHDDAFDDFPEDVDAEIEQLKRPSTIIDCLTVEAANLNPDQELRKLFGSAALKNERQPQKSTSSSRFPGKFILATPNDYWPPMDRLGLSMELISRDDSNTAKFSFIHSKEYQTVECKFLQIVSSMIPEMITQFNQNYSGHVGCQVLLAFMSIQTGDFNMAAEYLSRSFFSFEKAFDIKYYLTTDKKQDFVSRLPYYRYENRTFYLALFCHVCLLQRKGCWKTAFEVCKALLRLDPVNDPLGVWLVVDFLALRAENYQFVLDIDGCSVSGGFKDTPSWNYSVALAAFFVEVQDMNIKKDYLPKTLGDHEKSSLLLRNAIMDCPEIIEKLAHDCGVYIDTSQLSILVSTMERKRSKPDLRFIEMFADLYNFRCKSLYKQVEVATWMKLVIDNTDFSKLSLELKPLKFKTLPLNLCRHLYMTDWTNSTISTSTSVSLTKYIPSEYNSGPQSNTPWGSPQNLVLDPFPPTAVPADCSTDEYRTPVGPYEKYFKKTLILSHPHEIIPYIVSLKKNQDKSTKEILKEYGISSNELPHDLQHLAGNETANEGSSWSTVISFAESLLPWRNIGIQNQSGPNSHGDPIESTAGLLNFLSS